MRGAANPDRLRREGLLVAALDHPGIVRLLAHGEERGVPWLAYELVRGGRTLEDALPRVSRDRGVQLVLEVARAVAHAHARGVIHRDLKPSNVLLDERGGARLTDFGLGKMGGLESLTQSGTLVGTAAWTAPEQLRGEVSATGPWSDVWSLGALLYRVLTGQPAHDAVTLAELAAKVHAGPPRAPRALDSAISPALERVCLRALALAPDQRYPDAAELVRALEPAALALHGESERSEGLTAVAARVYVANDAQRCTCGRWSLRESRLAAPRDGDGSACCQGCGEAMQPPAGPAGLPQPGDRVGPLLVLERLGAGASGVVFRARHRELGREAALKYLPGALRDPRRAERFRREVVALGRLRHPGVVAIHSTFELGSDLACELQLVEGTTLAARLARSGPLPWAEAARVVAALARALAAVHAAEVLHRDVKPANVLLRSADGAPLLADLGLGRLTGESSSLTDAGAALGTPLYMAPETFEGRHSPASDVYGLGAVLHATLTGKAPWAQARTVVELAALARRGAPPLLLAGVPHALDDVRVRALGAAPEGRPTAVQLAEELERLELAGPAARRTPWPLWVGLVAVLVSLLSQAPWRRWRDLPATRAALASSLDAELRRLAADPDQLVAFAARPELVDPSSDVDRALGGALAVYPNSQHLRWLRGIRALRLRRPVDPLDLAAAAELHPAPPDLEAVYVHALARPDLTDALLEAALAVRRTHRGERLAWELGLACLRRGTPRWRDEARLVHSIGSTRGRSLSDALLNVDGWTKAAAAAREPLDAETELLAESLRRLEREIEAPQKALVLSRVLAPTQGPMRAGLLQGILPGQIRENVIRLLGPREEILDPPLLALLDVALVTNDQGERRFGLGAGKALALERSAQALAPEDPVLASWAWVRSIELGIADSPPELLRARGDRGLALLEGGSSSPGLETRFRELVHHRLLRWRTQVELLASRSGEAQLRVACLESALGFARGALERSQVAGPPHYLAHDARVLAGILLELDRPEEISGLLDQFPSRGVQAELLRRESHRSGARALAEEALRSPEPQERRDSLGVLALVAQESEDRAAADAYVERLEGLERTGDRAGVALDVHSIRARLAAARVGR